MSEDTSGGISSAYTDGCMIVYGGQASDRVWLLDTASWKWREVECSGDIPSARRYHTACGYRDRMIVFGGEGVMEQNTVSREHQLYGLDPRSGNWTAIATVGEQPVARSHHSAVITPNEAMVVFGGKPTHTKNITCESLREDVRLGFYDIYILNLINLSWHRIERYDPIAPMLWGHSSALFRHFMMVTGGFELDISDTHMTVSQPTAVMSTTVYIFDLSRFEWKRANPKPDRSLIPVARALHSSFCIDASIIMFGGLAIDKHGRPNNIHDCWIYDISSGEWRTFPFCLSHWNGKVPLGVTIGETKTTLLIANNQTTAYIIDINRDDTWHEQECDPSELYANKVYGNQIAVPDEIHEPLVEIDEEALQAQLYQQYLEEQRIAEEQERDQNRMRLQQQLDEETRLRQEAAINDLQGRIASLKGDLGSLENIYRTGGAPSPDQIHGTKSDHPDVSPPRDGTTSLHTRKAGPEDAAAHDMQQLQISQLLSTLSSLQQQSRAAVEESSKRHIDELAEAKRLHAERLAAIKQQQQLEQENQLKLAEVEMEQSNAAVMARQMALLKEQQEALLALQKQVGDPPPKRPAESEVPDNVRSMASAIRRLQGQTTRPHEPAAPDGIPEVLGLQAALSKLRDVESSRGSSRPYEPIPQGIPEVMNLRSALSRLRDTDSPKRSPPRSSSKSHIDSLRHQLQAIDQATRSGSVRTQGKNVCLVFFFWVYKYLKKEDIFLVTSDLLIQGGE